VGMIALARWAQTYENGRGTFFEAGWGALYTDTLSPDISSKYNSVPTLGLGFWLPTDSGTVWQTTIRLMHISNGGIQPPNRGQNQLQVLVGVRF
ncbi:MAG: acyloxyacyl hydrolase, partial [Fimbriimonadaceae bacterium]|nr:acyloxyacyl hydrolase [Fimbriimonadaceae bacterium]